MSVYHGDRAEWLALALESMAQQSLPPGEIVLVIDGPIDQGLQNSIRDFDTRYPGLLLVKALDRNGGLGPALNEGLAMCQYDFIVRMDADDISDLNRCEEEIRLLNDGYDMVGCNVWEFSDNPMRCDALRILPQTSNEIEAFAKKGARLLIQPSLPRRNAFLPLVAIGIFGLPRITICSSGS